MQDYITEYTCSLWNPKKYQHSYGRLQKISDAEFSDQRSQQISARKRGTNLYNENGKFSETTLKLLL